MSIMSFGGKSKFPLFDLPEMEKEKMLFYLEKQLKYEWARNVIRQGDLVSFSGNAFTFARTRHFIQVGDGGFIRVTTEGGKLIVMYRVSFVWIFFLYLAGSLFLALILIKDSLVMNTLLSVLALLCTTVGINIFFSLVSLAMFIERTFDAFMKK